MSVESASRSVIQSIVIAAVGAAVVVGGALPARAAGDASAAASFDGCRYLLPADVARVAHTAGAQPNVEGALQAEGFEAGTCAYQQMPGASTFFDTNMTLYTRASVAAMGYPAREFDDDGLFVQDAGAVGNPNQPGTPVSGIGDRASLYSMGSIAQLFVRAGGVRLALEGSGPLGNQAALVALAGGVLQRLAQSPPPPTANPAPNSLAPQPVTQAFGNGRAVFQPPGVSSAFTGGFGPYQIRNGALTTGTDSIGHTPDEVQLRGFALGHATRGLVAVLQFAAPVSIENQFFNTPIAERIGVTFRSPTGTVSTLELDPQGKGVVVTGDDVTAPPNGQAPAASTGNLVVFAVPPSLGVGEDWTATAWARAVATSGQLSGPPGLQGWQSATPAAIVGALDGSSGGQGAALAFTPEPGVPGAISTADSTRAHDLLSLPPSLHVDSIGLSGSGKNAQLAVTFAAKPNLPATLGGQAQPQYAVTFRLTPPGWEDAPMQVTLRLNPPPSPAPQTAGIVDGARTGSVPVALDGNTFRVALGKFTPVTFTPLATTPDPNAQRLLRLGTINSTYAIQPTIAPLSCICPHGAPAGFQLPASGSPTGLQTGPRTERLIIHLSGDAIAITRASTGTTAVGTIDPVSTEFVATNAHEMWAGLLSGGGINATYTFGLDRYSRLAPGTSGSARGAGFDGGAGAAVEPIGAAVAAGGAGAGGANNFFNPFGDLPLVAGGGQGGGQSGGASPPSSSSGPPCPEVKYAVIDSSGRWISSYVGPPQFQLPDPAQGWDQNSYGSNWDYGHAVSQGWRPTPCAPQNAAASASGSQFVAPIPLATASSAAFELAAARSDVSASLVPGDIAGNWWICGDVSVEAGSTQQEFAHAATPCVQAALLDADLPARTGASIGGGGSGGGAAAASATSASTHRGGGGTSGVAIAVIVIAALAIGGVIAARAAAARRARAAAGGGNE
jgi:hypothetical protein